MDRYIKIFCIIVIYNLTALSQPPSVLWLKDYGSGGWCYCWSVAETPDSGFIIAGYKEVFSKELDGELFNIGRVYVVRTDSKGDTLWTREYGGDSDDIGYSLQKVRGNGYIIAGKTRSFGAGRWDVYLIRIDSNGDTLWTKTYGTEENEEGWSVDLTSDNGFVIAGWTTYINPPHYSVYVVRTDSIGDTVWTRMYDLTDSINNSEAYSVVQTNDGGFAVTGYKNSNALLLRIDSNGDTLWTKTYQEATTGRCIQNTNDGGFIIAGYLGAVPSVASLLRTDSNGDTLWTRNYGMKTARSVCQTLDGGFIFGGSVRENPAVIRIDSTGNVLWDDIYEENDEYTDYATSVIQTSDGGFAVAGTGDFDTGSSPFKMILIRLAAESTAIQEEEYGAKIKAQDYNLLYNIRGSRIYVNFSLPVSGNVKLIVYDTQGRLVKVLVDDFQSKGSHIVKWNTRRDRRKLVAGGVYFIKLSANGHTVSKRVTVIR